LRQKVQLLRNDQYIILRQTMSVLFKNLCMMFGFLTEEFTWKIIQCTRELVTYKVNTRLLSKSTRYGYMHLI
jgi:hypothetical protein